ncbi:MAG: hypothetical protein K0R46_51 [Herbinix sp.]|nr:hypothetical protein [Herbinix sp.]
MKEEEGKGMKGKYKKIKVMMVALVLVMLNLVGNISYAYAGAHSITLSDTMENSELVLTPGEVKHMRVPIKSAGGGMLDAMVSVSASNAPFSLSPARLTRPDQTTTTILYDYGTTYVDFDINVKETAKIGSYPITIKVSSPEEGGTNSQSLIIEVHVLEELTPAQLIMSDLKVGNAIIGSQAEITFTLKNDGGITARNTYYHIDYGTTNIVPKYETPNIKVGDLAPGDVKYVTLPIGILSNAEAGLKTLTATFEYKDSDGTKGTDSHQVYVDVKKNEDAPELLIDSVTYEGELKPGADIIVKAVVRNYGEVKADNVTIKIDDATTGADAFYKNYFKDSVYVGGVKVDAKIEAKLPLTVSSQATGGNKKVNLILGYEDGNGNKYTSTITIYPEIIGGSSSTNSGLVINNVKQIPEQPIAGDNMQVSFDLQNKSQSDITEVKVSLQGLDGTTFIPTNSEPYILVDKIEAGKSKKISIPLKVSDSIPEGLNNLSVKYSYAGNTAIDPVIIPIRNVQNDMGKNSKPKLIISKYITDVEELRAGTTFNFTFDIYNTHSSIAAKNITVTITQADNIFSVTQGSNSFFISKIAAGETVQQSVELKVKSDASTKTYPLKLTIEYEYDGMQPNPETGVVGEKIAAELNLQAVENSRPVVDYVNVYSWDGNVVVGNPATLSFEFYNMGRSPLNNVIATVEGDFSKADGAMYFLGNVAEGSSTFAEFDVLPNLEGTANGVLRVSFEDSNGDKIEFTKEFTTEVMPATVFDPGMENGGSVDVFNPDVPVAKAAILPVWLFIIIQIVIVAVFIPVTRKVIISLYKAKLRKQNQIEN